MRLVAAKRRGVKFRIVVEAKANAKYIVATCLTNKGISVRSNGQYVIMHNKLMLIDDNTVQLGSYNYSAAAVKMLSTFWSFTINLIWLPYTRKNTNGFGVKANRNPQDIEAQK
ncbi:phospholipase D-like domain-containing protein [Serratia ureilytica]|uniref:phospholipase D-like domain-containing protein n=1 Tax=Serratia ureilytica TaxID=300181 RepID=UPI0023604459|nr:phospholipase D-like domain-containing protein [Serratia ureilytica]